MDFQFSPLELWRVSTLPQGLPCRRPASSDPRTCSAALPPSPETKAVVTAYERCIAAGDARGVAALRALIEVGGVVVEGRDLHAYGCPLLPPHSSAQRRIDDLENFYVAHVDDERSVLFEKQRLKLRKLLHEVGVAQPGRAWCSEATAFLVRSLIPRHMARALCRPQQWRARRPLQERCGPRAPPRRCPLLRSSSTQRRRRHPLQRQQWRALARASCARTRA